MTIITRLPVDRFVRDGDRIIAYGELYPNGMYIPIWIQQNAPYKHSYVNTNEQYGIRYPMKFLMTYITGTESLGAVLLEDVRSLAPPHLKDGNGSVEIRDNAVFVTLSIDGLDMDEND